MKWYTRKWIIYELRIWNQVKLWSPQLWTQFLQLRKEAWKTKNFNGVWTRDLAKPVRRSNQLSYEAMSYEVSCLVWRTRSPMRSFPGGLQIYMCRMSYLLRKLLKSQINENMNLQIKQIKLLLFEEPGTRLIVYVVLVILHRWVITSLLRT